MKIEILKEKDMPLLSRKRYSLITESDKHTPSRKELLKKVAENLKTKPELVVIKHIYTKYGSKEVKIIANVYDNKKDKDLIEKEYLLKKNSLEEKKDNEEATASA
ncbi:MAG: hypothetical protein ACLFNK_00045 [Candidatus Woesearchaeota archaeon]